MELASDEKQSKAKITRTMLLGRTCNILERTCHTLCRIEQHLAGCYKQLEAMQVQTAMSGSGRHLAGTDNATLPPPLGVDQRPPCIQDTQNELSSAILSCRLLMKIELIMYWSLLLMGVHIRAKPDWMCIVSYVTFMSSQE